jgi:hypothetical protein
MAFPTDQMLDTLTIYPQAGNSSHGPTFGSSYSEAAYVEPGSRIVVDQKGQEVVCNLWTVHGSASTVEIGDEAVYGSRRYIAIAVDTMSMGGAVHHVEVSWRSVGRG